MFLSMSGVAWLLVGIFLIVLLVVGILAGIASIAVLLWLLAKLQKDKGLSKRELNEHGLIQYHEETKYQRQPALKDLTAGDTRKKGWFSDKSKNVEVPESQRPIGVISFDGDIRASKRKQVAALVDEIIVNKDKLSEAVVVVNSPGGSVAEYGLLYAELQRLREQNINLTVCIDTYGASGGYLMSLPANKIVAAPFAVVGSIGVVAYAPNVHNLLKKHDIEPRIFTAGEYKRTVTLIGEDDEQARKHFQEQLESIHNLFIAAVQKYRSKADMEAIKTGDHWTAEESISMGLGLVDELSTSRDYLLKLNQNRDLLLLSQKRNLLSEGLGRAAAAVADEIEMRWQGRFGFFA